MLKNSYLNGNLSLQSLVEGYLRLGLVCCAMCTAFELRFCRDIKFPTSAEMRKCENASICHMRQCQSQLVAMGL